MLIRHCKTCGRTTEDAICCKAETEPIASDSAAELIEYYKRRNLKTSGE